LRLSPTAIVIAPVLVKLGSVPDWLIVRFPPARLMAPLLVCAVELRASERSRFSVSVP